MLRALSGNSRPLDPQLRKLPILGSALRKLPILGAALRKYPILGSPLRNFPARGTVPVVLRNCPSGPAHSPTLLPESAETFRSLPSLPSACPSLPSPPAGPCGRRLGFTAVMAKNHRFKFRQGNSNMSESNVKVAVRIRPLNRREIDLNTKCIIDVEGNQTILSPANANLGKGDARKNDQDHSN
ncbi:hypothetical protein chiPu_0015118 [Chiloscyllium punctatum]|uniref:Kinesin motor domain-containing protein n=1 Tax=Chiloscyllium punctatum TaxID=137246 RepID=A0A401T1U2_CHIPU|nr:hypothetical protein [Chiloscyllium punctatum]